MRKLSLAAALAVVLAAPALARAGFIVSASGGMGRQLSPEVESANGPMNVLVAPGYGLGEMVRAELGLVFDMPEGGNPGNFRLRPMLVIDPPILPVYGRLVLGVVSPFDSEKRVMEYGGALGVGFSLLGLGVYGEAGLIPQALEGQMAWIGEVRVGAFYAF